MADLGKRGRLRCRLTDLGLDWTAATLSMQLDREMNQYLADSKKRAEAKAKRGL